MYALSEHRSMRSAMLFAPGSWEMAKRQLRCRSEADSVVWVISSSNDNRGCAMFPVSKRRMLILSAGILFTVSLYGTVFAQAVTHEPLPRIFTKIVNPELHVGRNALHIIGLADSIANPSDLERHGFDLLFYLRRDASGFSPPVLVADTGWYSSTGLSSEQHSFLFDVAAPTDDRVVLAWSKQHSGGACTSAHFDTPTLRCVEIIGGKTTELFTFYSALAPTIATASDGLVHLVWEQAESLGLDSANAFSYYYRGAITYASLSSDNKLGPRITLGAGYKARMFIDAHDSVHVIWFRAPASTADTFQLCYRKGIGGVFGETRVLKDFALKPRCTAFEVDEAGIVHVGWEEQGYGQYGYHYKVLSLDLLGDACTVRSDTNTYYPEPDPRFLFNKKGVDFAAWGGVKYEQGNSHLVLDMSSSRISPLFESIRTFRSMDYLGNISLFMLKNSGPHCILMEQRGIRMLRNLEFGPDALTPLLDTCRIPYRSRYPVAVDAGDNIWCLVDKYPWGVPDNYHVHLLKIVPGLLGQQPVPDSDTHIDLQQNYPNPFTSTTAIPFTLSRRGIVGLRIYSALGVQIAAPAAEEYAPGTHILRFKADRLAPGIYYYTLHAGDAMLARSFVILNR
jgi:hypothetical protein